MVRNKIHPGARGAAIATRASASQLPALGRLQWACNHGLCQHLPMSKFSIGFSYTMPVLRWLVLTYVLKGSVLSTGHAARPPTETKAFKHNIEHIYT
jgi:hypothetical protein